MSFSMLLLQPASASNGRSGQYAQYLEAQLKAFASGQRRNDIYHRVRSVA
jgi:cytochrome c553